MAKKSKTVSKEIKSSSLNPEFDEVNSALLAEMIANDELALVCDECGQEYEFDAQFVDSECSNEDCLGLLLLIDGDNKLITLPASIKTGGSGAQTVTNGYTSYATGNTVGNSSYTACKHPGDKVIFEATGKQLFASNNSSINEWSGKWNLIIDLAGVVTVPNVTAFIASAAPKRFRFLDKLVGKERELPSEVLRLYWTDMGIPPVGLNFWQALWHELPEKTVIACMGGHGRTGTCLASFMISQGIDYYSAVETVRTEHCHKAIETMGQERYLHELYVQRMENELEQAEKQSNQKLIIDLKEDINFALGNKPTHKTTGARYQGWGDQSYLDNDEAYGAPSSKGTKSITPITIHYPAGVKRETKVTPGTVLAEALASGRNVKTINSQVFVEECIHASCLKVDCSINYHQAWKEWQGSLTRVEWALTNTFTMQGNQL